MGARAGGKRTLALSVVVGLIGLAGPSSGSAATQIGETFVPTDNCSPRTRVQSSSPEGQYAAPFAGVITSWSFQASSAGGDAPVRLKVARHAGGDNFTIVGESETQAIPDLDAFLTYPVRMPVQAGDVIGIYAAPASVFLCARPATGYVVHQSGFGEDVALGTTATFSPMPSQQLGVSALLEPDCDGDGFGDETQDAEIPAIASCDPDPPDTTITKGPKDKTKKKKATFEFSSSEPGVGFECSVDGQAFVPCSSPDSFFAKKGKHTFAVRARDAAGNVDASPASDDWKVKRKKKK